ncbi:MAG: hypothetical protein IJ545_04670 [Alphaproteobacteria bacterium]|nr:hypothetical protein [Alphaproteobacteria bacterium]
MTTVYKRNRKETATQYVVTAQDLQVAVIKYMMSEKYVPKKWRYMLAHGAMKTVSDILDNVIGSYRTFPNTEERLNTRRQYIEKAIIGCYQLQNRLLCMVRTIDTVNANNLGNITELLLGEIELLSKTLKNTHLVGQHEQV